GPRRGRVRRPSRVAATQVAAGRDLAWEVHPRGEELAPARLPLPARRVPRADRAGRVFVHGGAGGAGGRAAQRPRRRVAQHPRLSWARGVGGDGLPELAQAEGRRPALRRDPDGSRAGDLRTVAFDTDGAGRALAATVARVEARDRPPPEAAR